MDDIGDIGEFEFAGKIPLGDLGRSRRRRTTRRTRRGGKRCRSTRTGRFIKCR
jgi:hypothetical protein